MKNIRLLVGALAVAGVPLIMYACGHSNGSNNIRTPAGYTPQANGQFTVLVTGTTQATLEPCG